MPGFISVAATRTGLTANDTQSRDQRPKTTFSYYLLCSAPQIGIGEKIYTYMQNYRGKWADTTIIFGGFFRKF